MCGICGVALPAKLKKSVDPIALERMRDTMVHRGPDGFGSAIEGRIALGHRRLSIVDVAHGQQPMRSRDGAIVLVYNGEIYNHPTLMPALQAEGVAYSTHCDTETVVHLYEKYGEAFPQHCRGMFAVALWDARKETLLLARDRFGVKPLYYVLGDDGELFFASEIKALLEVSATSRHLAVDELGDFLANHAPSGDATLFRGVRRLPPGHILTWREGEIEIKKFWDLSYKRSPAKASASDASLVAEFGDRLREAVRVRLMADVPLGAFLSGGIDSAAITAIMAEMVDGPVRTFSVAFAEREANELRYARLVAERFKTEHHEVILSAEEFWTLLPRMIWHEDEPLAHPSSVALFAVARLASQHVKVVLTGEGSDEMLAGYNRYRVTLANLTLGGIWERSMPSMLRESIAATIGPEGQAGIRGKLARTFLAREASLDSMYFDNFSVFSRKRIRELVAKDVANEIGERSPYEAYHNALAHSDAPSRLGQLLYADVKTYLHELLMKQDQMSMAASIESRVPFLDHHLAEFVASLRDDVKLRGMTTKWLLRQSMRGVLPDEILSRKKMGFPVPVGAWLRGEWRHVLDNFVLGPRALARGYFDPNVVSRYVTEHLAGANHAERLWALINFEIWARIFLDGESPERIDMLNATRESGQSLVPLGR